eukprot:gene1898-1039_t
MVKNIIKKCEECEEDSIHYCVECSEHLCHSCSTILHSLKKRKEHHFEKEEEEEEKEKKENIYIKPKKNGKCDLHSNEKIIAICITCFELCCFECLKKEEHKDHEILELKENDSIFLDNFENLKKTYSICFNVFVETETIFKKKQQNCFEEISNYFNNLRSCLDLKENEMKTDLKEKYEKNYKILQERKNNLENIIFDQNDFYEKLKFQKFLNQVIIDLYDHRKNSIKLANSISFLHHENLEKIIKESSNIFEEKTDLTILQRNLIDPFKTKFHQTEKIFQFKKSKILIQMFDKNNISIPIPISTLKVEIFDDKDNLIPYGLKLESDLKIDGFCRVEFVPETIGKYKLYCYFKNEKVSEEPFIINCNPTLTHLDNDNGIIYNFGTNNKTTGFVNPVKESIISIISSSTLIGNEVDICDFIKLSTFMTKDEKDSFVQIKFLNSEIMPTKYTFKNKNDGMNVLRSWVLEVSKDEENWKILREHKHDYTLKTQKDFKGEWDLNTTELELQVEMQQEIIIYH